MSERACIRGCARRGVHYATCTHHGAEYEGAYPCTGCAPRECRDGSLICDRCFGRLRALVRDADDLMGRLRSLADPMKATPTDKAPGGRSASVEPPAPVDADLADAMNDISHTLHDWDRHTGYQLEKALPDLVNDAENVRVLSIGFLDRNMAVEGIRSFWSVQDAMDKWGVERRTRDEENWFDPDGLLDPVSDRPVPIAEWGNGFLTKLQAEQAAGSARTLRRWKEKGLIEPAGVFVIAGIRTTMYRTAEVARVKRAMHGHVGRPKSSRHVD